jgi:hypothetical protein
MSLDWLILIPAIFIHELGHYITFKFFKYKPSIKIHWFGIVIGENIWLDLKIREILIVLLVGVGAGYIPLLFINNQVIVLLYVILCSCDLTNVISLITSSKEEMNLTLYDYQVNFLKEWKKKKKREGKK